jgi:hypothetical protein
MRTRLHAWLRSPVGWLLVITFALEFFVFDQFGARRHTSVFPRWNDQIQYLGDSYTAYEFAASRGVVAGLLNAFTNASAQGTLHDFFALLVFVVAGPSRSAALSVNVLAVIAWQAALFFAVARTHGSRPLAFGVAMLPLAITGFWQNIPGSTYDFRLDHLALCGLGISAAVGLMTDGFRARRASKWFGAAAGATVLTRFLTGTYFFLIFAGLAVWLLRGEQRKQRLSNLLRSALIASAIAAPVLWINYDSVRDYYWVGHYVGPESVIRNANLGVARSFRFVVEQLAQRHLGIFFGVLAVTGALVLAATRSTAVRPPLRNTWSIGVLFFAAPLLILTLHPQKSEVVVGALAAGVVTLTAATWMLASRRASSVAISIVAALVAVSALAFFVRAQFSTAYPPGILADIRQVNTICDRIVARSQATGLKQLNVAVDHITDSLDAQVLRIVTYERKRLWLPFNMTLPSGISEPADALVMDRLTQSDFVFLTEEAPGGTYPYDRKLASMRPQLRAWCDAHLRAAERFTLFGRRMTLYQRREFPFP